MFSLKRLMTSLILVSMLTACGNHDRLDQDESSDYIGTHLQYPVDWPQVTKAYPELENLSDVLDFGTVPAPIKGDAIPAGVEFGDFQDKPAIDNFDRDSIVIVACNKAAEKVRWSCIKTKSATNNSCDIFAGWVFDGCSAEFINKRHVQ